MALVRHWQYGAGERWQGGSPQSFAAMFVLCLRPLVWGSSLGGLSAGDSKERPSAVRGFRGNRTSEISTSKKNHLQVAKQPPSSIWADAGPAIVK